MPLIYILSSSVNRIHYLVFIDIKTPLAASCFSVLYPPRQRCAALLTITVANTFAEAIIIDWLSKSIWRAVQANDGNPPGTLSPQGDRFHAEGPHHIGHRTKHLSILSEWSVLVSL